MPNFFERERAALVRLVDAVRERAAAEGELTTTHAAAVERAERDVSRARRANAAAAQKDLSERDSGHAAAAAERAAAYEAERAAADATLAERKAQMHDRYQKASQKGKTEFKDRLWTLDSVREGGEKQARDQYETLLRKAAGGEGRVAALWASADPLLARVGLTRGDIQPREDHTPADGDPVAGMNAAVDAATAEREALKNLALAKFAGTKGLVACVAVVAALAAAVTFPFVAVATAAAATGGAAVTFGVGLWLGVRSFAKKATLRQGLKLGEGLGQAEAACEHLRARATTEHESHRARLAADHARGNVETEEFYRPRLEAQKQQYDAGLKQAVAEHAATTTALKQRHETAATAAVRTHTEGRSAAVARFKAELDAAEAQFAARVAEAEAARDAAWDRAAAAWRDALDATTTEFRFLRSEGDRLFPLWSAPDAATRPLSTTVPEGVPFGHVTVDLDGLPDGRSADERLHPAEPLKLDVPAYVPFPDKCAVVLKARDEGRAVAVNALQSMMLRFLTGLPPGKVRFTILDPVGLGDNFAAFMHLADHDEKLVTGQIWTEPGQIEKRLVDLTDHIAAVIQKYLRNQYKTIEEYNQAAGEVAEPYRVLVVANFPAGFTPEAARRLVSVVNSGPSCGVCTLVSVDGRMAMPRDFNLADLEAPSLSLTWKEGAFHPKDAAFAPFPLALEAPPDAAVVAKVVQRVGKASLTAGRVEVPFSYIRPTADEVWTGDSSRGFEVPIGRAGATRRQSFRLGKGTAQHALIAGKTGSGKSTLLHAIISNLALIYSPEEAELYLIDFKKGVEFKDYAQFRLPHAKVVAIESKREFGLSVLQRLDVVLRERGDRFRDAGVNDLAGYRGFLKKTGGGACPRILLVVDEFQEFFVEDDKLAQETTLLLDRLVRQGRAFGLHVLLGSQTLGGSYSIPRATIDQMAIRIALQSSDADAQLILNKDNNAARLLSRPGEAIYNDANGMVEGNDPFQVVWMADGERERTLAELREKAAGKYPPPLVFEGSQSSDLAANPALAKLLANPPADPPKTVLAWLGEPVAIKEATAAAFRPQSAANLLVLGSAEDTARAVVAAAVVGIAAQLAGAGGRTLTLLDGTPDDSDEADALRTLVTRLSPSALAPARSDVGPALADLAAELDRRQKGETTDRTPRFLVAFGIHRFRELRKAEDDYSFRRGDAREVSPAERFLSLLREGPPLGIHLIVWCDSLTNLNRSFDRSGLREFGLRVLFQMSTTDSSTLVDSPIASRLGRNRALFVQEEQERPEKFRPYGWPADALRGRVPLNADAAS